jgi:DNA helicase II / ATP-dependent DNA helicase PcrA
MLSNAEIIEMAALQLAVDQSPTDTALIDSLKADFERLEDLGDRKSFTIHDRGDSADLLNLVRHDLGFSKSEKRFPAKGTCLAIYSRVVNAKAPLEDVLGAAFPWCATWEAELRQLFSAYVATKQQQNVLDYDDLLLYWAEIMAQPAISGDVASRFDHVLVDEYQESGGFVCSPDGRRPSRNLPLSHPTLHRAWDVTIPASSRNDFTAPPHSTPKRSLLPGTHAVSSFDNLVGAA